MASEFSNAQDHLNWSCELGDMAIWMRRYVGIAPCDNSDLGVVPETTQVWTIITSSILAWMEQVRDSSASIQRVDVDEVVAW